MVPCCWRCNRVSTENYIYIISGFRKYICGKGGRGGGGGAERLSPPLPAPRSQRHLEISNEMELFPSYGSEFFFFFNIFEAILFFSSPLEPFYFFSCISRTKIFLDKNPAPPPPPPPIIKWSVPYAICEQQRRRSAPLLFAAQTVWYL